MDHTIREQFSRVISDHVRNVLPAGKWERYRSIARTGEPVDPYEAAPMNASVDDIIDRYIGEEDVPIGIFLNAGWPSEEIGKIGNTPVYFIEEMGFYLWSREGKASYTMSFWATWPAYPPGY